MDVQELVTDELWAEIAPLLPPHPPHPKGGNDWRPDRPALCGILYVFKEGIGWNKLPRALGCGSGTTCWRRFRDWQASGVWRRLHRVLLARLAWAGAIDWSRASVDSASVPAKKGARRPGETRRTAGNRAPSTMSWSTATASRSRRG
jgi:transposase